MNSDKDLTEIPPDEYKQIASNRLKQLKTWQVIPNWIWAMIIIIGCILVLKEGSSWWLRLIGLIFVSYSSAQIGSRFWKVEDFMEGYEHGFSDGVERPVRSKVASGNDNSV
jgi:hypothetical protein